MRMARFWRALEDLNGVATTQHDWVDRLGEEWGPAATHLKDTGERAEELACPKASENGCMRQVVRLIDGRLRAECGDIPRRCDHIDLTAAEIAILEIDRRKLAKAIARALQLSDLPATIGRTGAVFIGRYEISAGCGFPVYLYLPQTALGLDPADLDPVAAPPPGPRLLLVPTQRSFTLRGLGRLDRYQTTKMALEDILLWYGSRGLAPMREPGALFADLVSSLEGAVAAKGPAIDLQPGTQWSSISIDFESNELAMLRGPGVQRAISPADLGLADRRNGRARQPWHWLRTFALHGGRMPTGSSGVQKHKQTVTEELGTFTGIATPAIDDENGHYVARFKLTASGLKQGRADQRKRNFVDED